MEALGGDLYESEVVDRLGEVIGSVGQVYLDDDTGQPSWVTVRTGLFGTRTPFVPLDRALVAADSIKVPYEAEFVRDAPDVDAGSILQPDDESRLRRYYDQAALDGVTGRPFGELPDDAA